MKTVRFSMWTLAAALTCAIALPVQARDNNRDCMQGQRAEMMQQRMTQKMEQRQATLKTNLKLTAEQEPAWQAFVQAMKPPARPARPNPSELDAMTTPQRLEKMKAMKAERDAHMNQRIQAIQTFYSVLTPDQQKVFDTQRPMRPHHREDGHRMHG